MLHFYDNSSADRATINVNGGMLGGNAPDIGGFTQFHNNATAAQAMIVNNGANAARFWRWEHALLRQFRRSDRLNHQ